MSRLEATAVDADNEDDDDDDDGANAAIPLFFNVLVEVPITGVAGVN